MMLLDHSMSLKYLPALICLGYLLYKFSKLNYVLLIFALVLGFSRASFFYSKNFEQYQVKINSIIGTQAKVLTDPEQRDKDIRVVLDTSEYGKVLGMFDKTFRSQGGEYIYVFGKLIEPPQYPDFDYKAYLKTQGINFILDKASFEAQSNRNKSFSIGRIAAKIRRNFTEVNSRLLPFPHATLLDGITLGIKTGMPSALTEALKRTGTSHIATVSGFNVGLIGASLIFLRGYFPRKLVDLAITIGIFGFVCLIGIDNAPALRAGLMGGGFTLASIFGKKGGIFNMLMLSSLIMVILNPYIFSSISFQLSVIALLGIWGFTEHINRKIDYLPSWIRENLSVSIAAAMATAPITTASFGGLSIGSVLVNTLVLPVVPVITVMGLVTTPIYYISHPLGTYCSYLVYSLLEYLLQILSYFTAVDMIFIEDITISNWAVIGVYILYMSIIFELKYRDVIYKHLKTYDIKTY